MLSRDVPGMGGNDGGLLMGPRKQHARKTLTGSD